MRSRPATVVIICAAVLVGFGLASLGLAAVRHAGHAGPAGTTAATAGGAGVQPAVDAAVARAAAALRARDRAGYDAALPAVGATARRSMDQLYRILSPLPWRRFALVAEPLGGSVYRVRAAGRLGAAGPDDRLAAERRLLLDVRGGRVTVVGDQTPVELQRRYLMALHDPILLQRPGIEVLADRGSRARAAAVAAAGTAALPRLARIGVRPHEVALITVFSSDQDTQDSLGISGDPWRRRFFAWTGDRLAAAPWRVGDVGISGPWLRDAGAELYPSVLHELAHAYTVAWFEGAATAPGTAAASGAAAGTATVDGGDSPHQRPGLLIEGVATAAAGDARYDLVRREVATGDQLWPLPASLTEADVWKGGDQESIYLGYTVGASLVLYVIDTWGRDKLHPFITAVVDSDGSAAGIDRAVHAALGVSWQRFYAGWKHYVRTALP